MLAIILSILSSLFLLEPEKDLQKNLPIACFQHNKSIDLKQNDIWRILMSVKYKYNKEVYVPEFDSKIKALDNTEIVLKGYMYPLEEAPSHSFFMLSYYPVSMCFFCGGAGPETVIEINSKKPIKYTNKAITLRGRLKLNSKDPERLFYILLNSEEI